MGRTSTKPRIVIAKAVQTQHLIVTTTRTRLIIATAKGIATTQIPCIAALVVNTYSMRSLKFSSYNIQTVVNNNNVVYNQLTNALMIVDNELFNAFANEDVEHLTDELTAQMLADGYLCPADMKEENVLLLRNHQYRYGNDTVRVTVMPTLNCNFSCWYCYESHSSGHITPEALQAIYLFCEQVIKNHKYRKFHLDWFGGEPMLYFRKVIFPLSIRIKALCESENVSFVHSITTNGYLIGKAIMDDIKAIGLDTFQITLDGSRECHNDIRFTPKDHDTYTRLVDNIVLLCRNMDNIDMTVRINYTPSNIQTLDLIADDLPEDVRSKIFVQPQLVWQFKDGINPQTESIEDKLKVFKEKGYNVPSPYGRAHYCYAESMSQFVINYDLDVYKCTARDFKDKRNCVGILSLDGTFVPSPHFYDYCVPSQMEHKECLSCELLPSCLGNCIQKCIEGGHVCHKEQIKRELHSKIVRLLKDFSL